MIKSKKPNVYKQSAISEANIKALQDKNERLQALIDYLSMMADIDIPESEESENYVEV